MMYERTNALGHRASLNVEKSREGMKHVSEEYLYWDRDGSVPDQPPPRARIQAYDRKDASILGNLREWTCIQQCGRSI